MRKKLKEILKKPPKLNHLRRLTTKDGILQHSIGSVPDPKVGYSIDDIARALIAVLEYRRLYLARPLSSKEAAQNESLFKLAEIYLNFIEKAQNHNHKFHNFKSYQGKFLDKEGSEDSFGRTIWALGYTVGQKGIDLEFKKRTNKILKKSLDLTLSLSSPRAKAFSLIGLWWLKDKKRTRVLANSLVSLYKENQTRNWKWFEENLTYSNAILPLSLFLAYNLTKDKKYLEVAKESFDFLLKICRHKGVVSAIGQAGWYKNKGTKALFDQQPVDPANMVLASTQAYKTTKNKRYLKESYDWFGWFYGENIGRGKVVDQKTGAVFDGLTKDGVNINQGAESTVSYLLAHLSLTELF